VAHFAKDQLRKLIRKFFNYSILSFSRDAQDGLRHVARLLSHHRWKMGGLVFAATVAAVLEGGTMGLLGLAVSVLVGEVDLTSEVIDGRLGVEFDNFLATTSASGLFLLLVGLAIIAQLLKSVLLYISQAVEIGLSYDLKREIQQKAVNHLMRMSYRQVSGYSPGEVANAIDQADVVAEGVNSAANVVRATLMLLAYLSIMFAMSVKMTLATAIVAVLLWVALSRVVRLLRELGERSIDARVALWRWTVEFLNAPRLLRIFNATDFAADAINMARDEEMFPERKGKIIQAAIKPAIEAITILGAGVFLLVGYALAGNGAQSVVPQLFVYVLVFYRLKPQISAFNDFRVKLAWIMRRLELVGEFLRTSGKEFLRIGGRPFKELDASIRFQNVSFQYAPATHSALKDVTLTILPGQTVAIVGPSGAGKSTLVDLLIDLYQPTRGDIFIGETNLADLDSKQWRDKIGMVDQNILLLNSTVSQNIRFGRADATQAEVAAAAKLAHADEFIEDLNEGYETPIGEKGFKLSGGQRQRLALARALMRNPDLLILDEATSALDSVSEKVIQAAIDEMHETRTILIIAHRLSTIASADHVIFLDRGQIVEQGSPEALRQHNGRFAELWSLQIGSSDRAR
jgi:ATP-binding cassette, subfamily B, bacterial MsbA